MEKLEFEKRKMGIDCSEKYEDDKVENKPKAIKKLS